MTVCVCVCVGVCACVCVCVCVSVHACIRSVCDASSLMPPPAYLTACLPDTFDVYVARNGTVRLVDFNPFGGSTLPLLFTWTELLALHSEQEGREPLNMLQQPAMTQPSPTGTIEQGMGDQNGHPRNRAAQSPGAPMMCDCRHNHNGVSPARCCDEVEMRIIESQGMIQPCLGAVSGTPFELHDRSEGSAWEEMMARLQREGQP